MTETARGAGIWEKRSALVPAIVNAPAVRDAVEAFVEEQNAQGYCVP